MKTLTYSLKRAIDTAEKAHEGQVDYIDMPYILHLFRVMQAVSKYGEHAMMAAVLHDAVEDTTLTLAPLDAIAHFAYSRPLESPDGPAGRPVAMSFPPAFNPTTQATLAVNFQTQSAISTTGSAK